MILELVGTVAVIGVAGFLFWERDDMAKAIIHAELREMRATNVRVARDWFSDDRDTMTYDVEYTAADGSRKASTCKVSNSPGSDARLYWTHPE